MKYTFALTRRNSFITLTAVHFFEPCLTPYTLWFDKKLRVVFRGLTFYTQTKVIVWNYTNSYYYTYICLERARLLCYFVRMIYWLVALVGAYAFLVNFKSFITNIHQKGTWSWIRARRDSDYCFVDDLCTTL